LSSWSGYSRGKPRETSIHTAWAGRLGERLHLFHLFGYGLVLIGVFVAARKPKTA
jgi:hypothetical protein